MRSNRKRKSSSAALKEKLGQLEDKAKEMGIHVHYDILEAAGLKLKGGLCKINGDYHLFVDRRKSTSDRIEALLDYLDEFNPEDIPLN